ncbi:hypothetical protein [Streptomyces sp. N50]|uniref:hypothetical protein n=1 Tax=Streptomyces sp. N50 TaxID=3081765 RepID=UPI0029620A51|nr:hypothetical protein [Streptomyces sp. N50]WOX10856.1 hypothetical protein R2B38_19375 [Streptomyces sp. N50]
MDETLPDDPDDADGSAGDVDYGTIGAGNSGGRGWSGQLTRWPSNCLSVMGCSMRREARGPVAALTCDPALVREFRLYESAPLVLVLDTEARRYPSVDRIADALGGTVTVTPVPIPYGGTGVGTPGTGRCGTRTCTKRPWSSSVRRPEGGVLPRV